MVVNRETGGRPQSFSLPYEFRLHQRNDFTRFFEGSSVARLKTCLIFRIPNQHGHCRLGLTFKIRCNSVERNALRRRVRESFRRMSPSLGSYDYNVVLRSVSRPARRYAREIADEITHRLSADAFVEAHSRASARKRD